MTPGDPFSVLGLEPSFDLDMNAAEQRFRELSRVVHPDRFAGAGGGERRRALGKAVDLNEAWRLLRDPIRRAEALLRRHGVAFNEAAQPRPSQALLMEFLELREELAEARAGRDLAAVGRLDAQVKSREQAVIERARAGFAALAAGGAGRDAHVAALLDALGEWRYIRRFFDEVRAIEEEIG